MRPEDSAKQEALATATAAYRAGAARDLLLAPHADDVFERLELLGEGGMGVVERVRDRRLGREAALKRIRSELADEDALRRFRREARVSARLQHPAIPVVYECGTTPSRGDPYLLMRVVEGEELRDAIARWHASPRQGSEVPRELLEALARASEAVAYAHAQGVIHRDLKPQNVMLGGQAEVLVMDWGLARVLDAPEDEPAPRPLVVSAEGAEGLTQAGSVMGTPGYMPPEQAEGAGAVGTPADVFALGAILVEVLTGRPPIEGASVYNKLNATLTHAFVLPRDRRPELPGELHSLAAWALSPEPSARPSALEFLGELRAWLEGRPLSCHGYTRGQRLRRWASQRSLLLSGLGTALLVGALGAGAVGQAAVWAAERDLARAEAQARSAAAERARQEEATRRRLAAQSAEQVQAVFAGLERAEIQVCVGGPKGALREELERILADPSYDEARERYDPALATWAARILALGEDGPGAKAILEHSIRRFPTRLEPYWVLHTWERGRDYVDSKPLADYLEQCRAAGSWPDNEIGLLAQGNEAAERGEHAEALALIEAALQISPRYASAHRRRAFLLGLLGRKTEAREAFSRALELDPLDSQTFLSRAGFLRAEGDMLGAYADYSEALIRAKDPRIALARAELLLENGHFLGASSELSAVPERGLDPPSRAYKQLLLARVLLQLGNLPEATRALEALLEARPKEVFPRILLVRLSLRLGKLDQASGALGSLRRALQGQELPPATRDLLELSEAEVRLAAGDSAGARQRLDLLLAERPGPPTSAVREAWLLRARCRKRTGDLPGCLADLGEAARRFERDPRGPQQAGDLHAQAGRASEAEVEWREAVARNAKQWRARLSLARSLLARGQRAEALEHFEGLTIYNPNLPAGHGQLGLLLAEGGQAEKARFYLETYLRLAPRAHPMRARVEAALAGIR